MEAEGQKFIPTDVGYAWVIVAASFLIQLCAVGVPGGFGVYLNFYSTDVFPDEKMAKMALIGTLIPFVIGIFSVASGWLCDKFGVRVCIVAGAFVTAVAHVLASFGTHVWHLILTQGVLYGVGGALVYIPAIILVTEWFEKRQGLAVGIGAAGGGVGGAIFTQVNSRLLLAMGHVWTLRLNGAFHFFTLLLVAAIVRRREQENKEPDNAGFTKALVMNGRLVWFASACLFGGIGYLIPLHFAMQHAASLNMTSAEGGYILIAMNLGSGVGRVSMGLLGDYTGLMKSYMLAICLSILASVMWLFSTRFVVMVIFGILYGISSGGYVGSFGAVCRLLFGKNQLATLMGISNAFVGTGNLLGPIMSGMLIDNFNDYNLIIYLTIGGYTLALLALVVANYFAIRESNASLSKQAYVL